MTEPAAEPTTKTAVEPDIEPPADEPAAVPSAGSRQRHLGMLSGLAIASMLIAGGLLMAIGGVSRLAGPAPATPTPAPTVIASPRPVVTPAPSPLRFPTPPGPSLPPQGDMTPATAAARDVGDPPQARSGAPAGAGILQPVFPERRPSATVTPEPATVALSRSS